MIPANTGGSYTIQLDKSDDDRCDIGLYQDYALSDEVFTKSFLSDPYDAKKVDDIENITVQIFAHLHSLADRVIRSEIEEALAPPTRSVQSSPVILHKSSGSQRFRPFRKETNFNEREDNGQTLRIKDVAWNTIAIVQNIFFGVEFFESHKDNRTTEKMMEDLKTDSITWNQGLRKHYSDFFNSKFMMRAFIQADELLKNRQNVAKESYKQRVTLYVLLILSVIGKLKNKSAFTIVGLAASSITLIFMLVHYGMNSFKLSQRSAELKRTLETAENEARSNRLTHHALSHL
jgi:hypothetical protein